MQMLRKSIVYKLLEGCRSISQATIIVYLKVIANIEGCFLFVAFYNLHQIIHIIEINLDIDTCLLKQVKEVRYQRK